MKKKQRNAGILGAGILSSVLLNEQTVEKVNQAFKDEAKNMTITGVDASRYPIIPETKSGKHMGKKHKHKNKKFF